MKILVPVKQGDAYSLEAALQLCESAPDAERSGCEAVAVTVGDERSEPALRAALAMGADRAVRVWDGSLADTCGQADVLTVACLLAAIAERECPDLILCGAQSSDMANAATGVALAGLLELTHVAFVSAIERDADRLVVQRELEGGAVERLRISLPALLTVATGASTPRRPNLRALKRARAATIAVLGAGELGLDAQALAMASGARTVRLVERPRETGADLIEGTPAEIAARIAAIVKQAMAS